MLVRLGLLVVSIAVWGLHGPAAAAAIEARQVSFMSDQNQIAPIDMAYTSTIRLRPPMSRVLFDAILRNTHTEPEWFLLPYNLLRTPRSDVDVVEVYELHGTGRVVVGHLGGLDGMYALLVPPGGRVRLRGLPLLALDEPPERANLEVVVAGDLRIGGEPAAAWFGMDPMSDVDADVQAEALRDQAAVQTARYPEGGGEVPAEYDERERIPLELALTTEGA